MNKLFIILLLLSSLGFSQNLEELIYVAAETFQNNQNEKSLQLLNHQESNFKKQVNSKEEQLALVFLQSNKAYYLDHQSKLKDAIETYEDAIKRYNDNKLSTLSDFDIIEYCLKPLGNLYTKTGDYTNALGTLNQYIFLAEKSKNTAHQTSGAINLSKLYYTLGNHEMVLKITNNFNKVPNINSSQQQKLKAINLDSQIALNLISESENMPLDYGNDYKNELQKGNYNQALISFKTYKNRLLKKELTIRKLAQIYIEEAQLNYLLKNPEEALKHLQLAINILLPNFNDEGLPNKTMLYAENKFIDIFDLYAECEPNPKIALQSLDLSFWVSNLLQNSWTSQETKILNQTNNRIRSEKCIDILFDAYSETKNKTLLFKALQYSESNKASVLKDMFQKKMRLQRFPNDSLLIKEFSLLKEQERVTSLLVKEQLDKNQTSKINTLSIQLNKVSLQLKSLKIAIAKKHPGSNELFSLEALQAKLIEDESVLAEYFYGKNNIYQFVISGKEIAINQIPLKDNIKKDITAFINLFNDASIINNNIQHYTNQAFNIYKLLKFDTLSPYKNVLIIPDGLLNFIPFEGLLKEETKTSSFSKMPFVITTQKIAYNSSIVLYLNKIKKHENNTVLGFFPVFENTKQALTYSISEAEVIKNEMPSHLFMYTEATKLNFNKNASSYGVLHLSTHASSGDFVKPSNLSFYDDTLFLNELYSLDLNTNLVVLSACETGIGKLYKGEGAMSISRGFQYAGAQHLLFSLWEINDLSTSQIMQSFYKNFNTHHSAFVANNLSKIEYLQNESISNIKKSPYYWSAFVFYGAPEVAKSQNFPFYIFFWILIVLIILFLLFKLKTHGRNSPKISSSKRIY